MYTARGPNWAARWRPVSRTRIDGTRRLRRAGSRPSVTAWCTSPTRSPGTR